MRNIFLEKSSTKYGGETEDVFIVCQIERYQNILKLSFRPLAYIKLF